MTGPEAVARLFGVGFLWMGVHCAGMCGPLLLGLDVAGTRAGTSALGGALRTVLYQLGKGVTYAVLGAVAGLVGAGLEEFSSRAGGVLAIVFGVAALAQLAGLSALWPKKRRLLAIGAPPATTDRLLGLVRPLLVSSHPLRPFALGLALAFLPCMIALWALGLAALTGSPLWGAVVMLSLTVATTPLLLLTSTLTRGFLHLSPQLRGRLQRGAAAVAALWLILIGGAGLDLIPHVSRGVTLFGHGFMLMLF